MFLTHVHITCNCPLTKISYKNRLFCIVQREIILSRLCWDRHESIESLLVIGSRNSSFAMRKIVRIDAFYMNTYSRHWRLKRKDFFFKFKFIYYYFQKKITFLSVYVEEPTKSIYFEIVNHIDVSLIQLYYFNYELSVKLFYSNLLI